jgi:cellulose biosynthesis protein BcsQ
MMTDNPGKIFTFYSYKGGTGRSMALANVACLLATKWVENQRVLMIDWDLEAPGLHRFFEGQIGYSEQKNGASLFQTQLGLIDLFGAIKESVVQKKGDDILSLEFFDRFQIEEKYIIQTDIPSLYLMTAGRFDDSYASRVNTFNWESLFNSEPLLISKFAEYLSSKYDYILIDSRTGFTDISGVCTSLMPERLVVVFTPNRQSLTGVVDLIAQATGYRKQSTDLRPLLIFPLVSRVENAEKDLQDVWRFGNKFRKVIGYQRLFEESLKDAYGLLECDLNKYFNEVQVQYVPRFSYGEEIAVLSERADDRLSLTRSYENLTRRLVLTDGPWQKEKIYKRPLKIFLCHVAEDKPQVRVLYQLLQENGFDPWLDEEKLLPGQRWDVEIRNAMNSADVILVCMSRKSVGKEGYVQQEIKIALELADEKPENAVFLIPVRLEECEIPRRLARWQWVDLFREQSEEWLLRGLAVRSSDLGLLIEE